MIFGYIYAIAIQDPFNTGFVSYKNEPTTNQEDALTFETQNEAFQVIEKLQPQWRAKLIVVAI